MTVCIGLQLISLMNLVTLVRKSSRRKLNTCRSYYGSMNIPRPVRKIVESTYKNTLRPYLPRRLAYFNGYIVRYPKLFDTTDVNEDMQQFEVSAHNEFTQSGDSVVVVGVGSGVSTLAAAENVGHDGDVQGYEAGADLARAAEESASLNDLADRVSIVGSPVTDTTVNTWGSVDNDPVLPSELPEADVLELDCEGAEYKILNEIQFRPRVIIVEIHSQFGVNPSDIHTWLESNEYSLEKQAKNDEVGLEWIVATRS
ncbi:hypothetical protein CK500_05380 [Halorubrum salipaludis]|uniref:Methyltransferase FkbM domain-containing protein n=1 Tax=Halorubrum salipaludis TaxID=2032630 RepID=A0A2A2FJ96_9EURY|nr:FkbM family methyltransferase [Halorubrum salipaludis]PAU84940.1 hypothetical protein CK500_05380 [Halorubrum salipaludis]